MAGGDQQQAREEFLAEAQELVETLSRDVLQLEQEQRDGTPDPDLLNDLFRGVHTLKGLSGMFDYRELGRLAHVVEDLLEQLRMDRLALTQKAAANEKSLQTLRSQSESSQAALQRDAEDQKARQVKWEAAYKEAADTARARDGDAKRFEAALTALREQNRVAEQKNTELYKLGQELLSLYENKKLFDVMGAGEPVTKLKRVEYENVMQDYQDRLRASRIVRPAAQ